MIKGIIFDLGDTLLQFQGNLEEAERQGAENIANWFIKKKRININAPALVKAILAARQAGIAETREALRPFLMRDAVIEALQTIQAPTHAETLAQQAVNVFFQAEEGAHVPLPGAIETLKALYAQNLKLGLLSNASDDALIQRLVNRGGLRPWLSPVFSSAGLGWQKPKAAPFLLIAERWQLPPKQIAVVGDTLTADILGAHNAGMHGILVTEAENPRNNTNRHIKPDITIATLSELLKMLKTL